jgi:phosphopantothenoylcysteine decarboxylase/phosphopantothenate--cysteine ligase
VNLLITAGATREPIDDVRFISNVSTGATGAALADAFTAAGHRVTLLRGSGSTAATATADTLRQIEFSSAADLLARLRQQLSTGGFDGVIMTAAVSDYRAATTVGGKLPSAPERMALELVRNPKILPLLKTFSPKPLVVVGFKLTSGADEPARTTAITAQFAAGGVDAVVHNDLAEIRTVPREQHPFRLYRAAGATPEVIAGAGALARVLAGVLAPPSRT